MSFPIRKVIASILFWAASASAQTATSTSQYERWGEMLRRESHQTVITETTAELARNPKNALALRMRAQAYANVEQVPLALQDRDAIAPLVMNPVTAEEYETLCYAYRSSEKHSKQEAIALCDRAIELNPRTIFAYYNRGQAYQGTNEYDKAIADFTKVIELDSRYYNAYRFRGDTYNFKNEYKHALDDYGKAIELNPKNGTAYVGRGFASLRLDNLPAAISDLTKAVALLPKNFSAHLYLGDARAALKEYALALVSYNKAIELQPKNASAYYGRGVSYRYLFIRNRTENRYYSSALSDFTRAIELDSSTSMAYLERAKLYGFNEEFKAAITDLTKVIELDGGDNPEAYCIRYYLYGYSGQKRLADADFARLSNSGRNCKKFRTRNRPGDNY